MKFDTRTIAMMQSFTNINQSAFFREGQIQRAWNEEKTVIAKIELEVPFPQDFAIYDMSKFLSAISVFESPEFTFKENYVIIKSENGQQKMKYVFAEKDILDIPNNKDLPLDNPITEFEINEKDFKSVMKALSALKQSEIAFTGKNGKVSVASIDKDNDNSDTFSIEDLGKSETDFKLVFLSRYLLLPVTSYKVSLYDKKVAKFESKDSTYWIAAHANSSEV